MGMFDEIFCEYPLPDNFDASGIKFQTKDLENHMNLYTITEDGRLVHHYVEWEATPEELLDPSHPFLGCIREKEGSQKLVDTNHHGDIEFYSSNIAAIGHGGFVTSFDKAPWDRTYSARFTDGNLSSIRLVTDKADYGDCIHMTSKDWHKLCDEKRSEKEENSN